LKNLEKRIQEGLLIEEDIRENIPFLDEELKTVQEENNEMSDLEFQEFLHEFYLEDYEMEIIMLRLKEVSTMQKKVTILTTTTVNNDLSEMVIPTTARGSFNQDKIVQ